MKFNINKSFKKIVNRNLIKKDEGKLTYVQLFGFMLITFGVIFFASFLLPSGTSKLLPFLDQHPDPPEV
ncbi:hypothetical protein, partial [Escherichia coli]|uniref:hypothetical protein n=1 Tax=Escherichia coli TaxID=562 RepID=UPI003CE59801